MPKGPKHTGERIEMMTSAWQELAPDKSFGGMTRAQFQTICDRSLAARQRLEELEAQRLAALAERDAADADFKEKAQQVVAGVRADPTEGPDSALYKAFGYTPDSERRSGLTRKKKPPTT